MTELIGALLDKVIMIGAGVYAAFIYPSSVKKRVEAGTAKEDEIARLKWIRPVGFGLINYNWFTSGGFQICLIYSPPHFGRHRHP